MASYFCHAAGSVKTFPVEESTYIANVFLFLFYRRLCFKVWISSV